MQDLTAYIEQHIDSEHPYLYRLWRATNLYQVRGHMASGHLQGVLLRMLVEMIRPRRVLEIGTYTGYSALSMASGLDDGALIDTYEINDELEDFTRRNIEESPWADKVRLHIGDVLQELKDSPLGYDLIFIDGNKRQYCEYYALALNLLNPRGYILADNTLWDGHIIDPAYDRDTQTLGIRRFNEEIARDKRVEKVIIPMRDGLTLIRVK
ncbi:MAG: O-methyltransferase [Bacteroidaceae bacterium]|nr:O-methyltransferase [Bacteroidaceae bacterium]MBR3372669.1 O-methyltransferase [Bacteroidaceae bacterium]MBR3633306.1 O-methyltransferase [Bacteroidaceae bacterium]